MTNPYEPPAADDGPRDEVSSVDISRLQQIARHQRNINLVILANIASAVVFRSLPSELAPVSLLLALVIVGLSMYSVYRLAEALHGSGWAIACTVLMLVPCVSVIVLLVVSQGATRRLQAAGYKVGLLGANPDAIR